jgi:predicted RNA-binding Zn-ribbon protein involved in translation (DUF1610 family)
MKISTEELLSSEAPEKYEIQVVTEPKCDECGWKHEPFDKYYHLVCPKCRAEIWQTRVWERGCLCIINERQL